MDLCLSDSMKLVIGVLLVVVFILVVFWWADVSSDQGYLVEITERTAVYGRWDCGYKLQVGCEKLFYIAPVKIFKVERIRYGKDFMAVKIKQGEKVGWIMFGGGVEVYERPSL